jgi:hypothetical protein
MNKWETQEGLWHPVLEPGHLLSLESGVTPSFATSSSITASHLSPVAYDSGIAPASLAMKKAACLRTVSFAVGN